MEPGPIQLIAYKALGSSSAMEPNNKNKCANCGEKLDYAAYVWGVQEGVIGGKGFVPTHLHDWLLFCSKDCLVTYMENGVDERHRQQPRIP